MVLRPTSTTRTDSLLPYTALFRSGRRWLGDRGQRRWTAAQRAQVGDHVGDVFGLGEAAERHLGARREGSRVVQEVVQVLVGPGITRMVAEAAGVAEASFGGDRVRHDIVKVGPEIGRAHV